MEEVQQVCLKDYIEEDIPEDIPEPSPEKILEEDEEEEEDGGLKPMVYSSGSDDSGPGGFKPMVYSSDASTGGGPKKKKDVVAKELHNIDGMSLSHPYFFQQRMEDRAKTLFTSMKGDKFKSYSRMCPSSIRRQPVILSKKELDETRAKYPGEYSTPQDVLEYSSNKEDANNPESFYYVCPRYWCLKTNSIISEEDVAAGKCGGILPPGATKVTEGNYVYEFSAEEEHKDEKGNYIKHFPGFHKNATGDNKCIPCCYKKFSDKQIERRKQCEGVEENPDSQFSLQSDDIPPPPPTEELYILGPEKFPLGSGRWGRLPVSVQQFFKDVGAECKVNKNNKNKSSCLLRHGVEKTANKSFLACIVDALYYAEQDNNKEPHVILEVKTFIREKLLNAFDLDTFMKYQNGTLYDNFAESSNKSFSSVDNKYKTTMLYIKTDGEDAKNKQFFMNVINAYERFCDFLQNDKSYIDYTYLWDIICKPNPKLFVNGLNLIILNIPDADATTNIEFVCPTNHYSKEVYESRRRTLILLSRDEIFEPVYEYKDIETKIIVTKTFSEYDRYLSPGMHSVLTQIVKPLIKEHCKPLKMNTYEYDTPILLDDLIKTLNTRKYKIESQVINLRGKVIGILATDTKQITGFVPCYPSSISTQLNKPFVYITDDIWTSYERTLGFLSRWYKIKKTAKRVAKGKCTAKDDICKVLEDGVIIGFLTKTNQFIQIRDPMPNVVDDNLHHIENNNYLIADNAVATAKNEKDKQRTDYSRKIKLENNYYSAFRSAVRILLNDYSNLDKQQDFVSNIYNPHVLYADKIQIIIGLLKTLTVGRLRFIDQIDVDETEIMSSCLSVVKDKCNDNPACFYSHGNCGLNLPRYNLLSPDTDNSELYFLRLADEMVRYNRIKTFLFQRKNYLLFENLGYNLRANEIIILQSLLTQQYFESLIPSKQNARLMNAYDTANPTDAFKNQEPIIIGDIKHIVQQEETVINPVSVPVKYVALKQCLPTGSVEITYPALNNATFQFASDIIRQSANENLTQNEIRDKLDELYNQYSDKYKIQIANILIQQGKKTFGSYIKAGTLQIKHMIYTEGYYLTNLDLWLLLDHYKVQSILISHKTLLETGYNSKYFAMYADQNGAANTDKYVFIVSSAIKVETPPSYKYIEYNNIFSLSIEDDMQDKCMNDMYITISNIINLETYIRTFKPISTTTYVKKQPGFRIVPDNDTEEEEEKEEEKEEEIKEKEDNNKPTQMQIPDFANTPVPVLKIKRKYTKKTVENRHKPHAKTKKNTNDDE